VTDGVAPLPAALVAGGLVVTAFAAEDPVVLAAVLAVAILLLHRSTGPRRLFAVIALATGAAVAIVNPLVATQGDLILIDGPQLTVLDLQVTLEELLYGAAAGTRLAAVTMLTGAFLGLVDRDRLAARASRAAPRSTLTVTLAARLLPALRRDAAALVEATRLRGVHVTGARRETARAWGALIEPLCAAALDRGVEHAEAMAARGYGPTRPTALPERALDRREWAGVLVGAGICALAAWALAGHASFSWYPTADAVTGEAVAAAAVVAALGAAAALSLGGRR
jgi:energy-coupling factor transporter transmembrane protein EcfT